MSRFELRPRGPYALATSIKFLEGFVPAAYQGSAGPDRLALAFVVDDGEQVTGVSVRSQGETVVGEVFGEADPAIVRRQVARILSLDVDGNGFADVGQRDPVIGRLQARYPGLRPVLFYSPYEAAAWSLISHRIRITQAARIKARMAADLGPVVEIHGVREHAFPSPSRLLELEAFPGLFGHKIAYLRDLARATIAGQLDAAYLRSLPAEDALAQLKMLPGIGDFSAELILLRGVGETDYLPTHEPRLGRAVARAYGLDRPPAPAQLEQLASPWRPYRTWATFLLRVMLEEETHEIASGTGAGRAG